MPVVPKETADAPANPARIRLAIVAASAGTIFEWYDFFLYGSLAAFFGVYFFPPGNQTAAFLASLATFGAGFAVRPIGALVFGALGDRIGRKRSFQITMVIMGAATFAVGLLPSYAQVGLWAPVLLVTLRLAQGLAVGGEYGGAATYVAEYAPSRWRGYATSWLQTTSTLGFLLSLLVILGCRVAVGDEAFRRWGWRIPFLTSVGLLAISVYIRRKLAESPIFEQLKAHGRASRRPIAEALGRWENIRRMLILLFGITTGMTVVWYTSQFYALFFLQGILQVDYQTSYAIFTVALLLGTPLIVFFGGLSDRIGRRPVMITGLVLAALTLRPAFLALAQCTNPELIAFAESAPITISGNSDGFSVFTKASSDTDKAREFFIRHGLSYRFVPDPTRTAVLTTIGESRLEGFDEAAYRHIVLQAGMPSGPRRPNFVGAVAAIIWMIALVGMVYGPMAAFMVELFPAPIRSTSLSLPYHLGVGILGGFLPFVASALTVYYGNIFAGLWYPVIIAGATAVVGFLVMPETKGADIT